MALDFFETSRRTAVRQSGPEKGEGNIMNATLFVLLFSLFVLFVINLGYRLLMNQRDAKSINVRVRELNEQSKAARKQGDHKTASQLMSDSFREKSKLTMMSLKPMLLSFAVVLVLLPMLSNVYGDKVVELKDNRANITIDGFYEISVADKTVSVGNVTCETPCRKNIGGGLWNVKTSGSSVEFSRIVALLPVTLPFLGDDLGWLGWYIIISIPVMVIQRKLLKIHM